MGTYSSRFESCMRLQDSSKQYISFTKATTHMQRRLAPPRSTSVAKDETEAREDRVAVLKEQAFII
jgi:hypothetical protein